MTEEEIKKLAGEYVDGCTERAGFVILTEGIKSDFIDLFVAGFMKCLELNVGKLEWHDLRKDPNDLPKDRHNVWITYINGYYETETTEASFRHKYWVINGHRTECDVIAWCEIPKFDWCEIPKFEG